MVKNIIKYYSRTCSASSVGYTLQTSLSLLQFKRKILHYPAGPTRAELNKARDPVLSGAAPATQAISALGLLQRTS